MSKRPITPTYTFTPSAGTLNLSGITSFDVRNLFAVINLKTGALMYAPLAGYGYTALSGTTLTLTVATTSMGAGDPLMIIYDDGTDVAADQTALNALQTNATARGAPSTASPPEPFDAGASGSDGVRWMTWKNLFAIKTLLGVLPASRGAKAVADTLAVSVATDQPPIPILPFVGLKRQSLEITATTTATGSSGFVVPATWLGATAFRVRNPAASASPVTFALTDQASMPPVVPVAYAQDGTTAGTLGDKTIDPGAVEVFQFSATQLSLLAAGTLRLSVITKSGTGSLVFTPGSGV